jgi:hypothetical protein
MKCITHDSEYIAVRAFTAVKEIEIQEVDQENLIDILKFQIPHMSIIFCDVCDRSAVLFFPIVDEIKCSESNILDYIWYFACNYLLRKQFFIW